MNHLVKSICHVDRENILDCVLDDPGKEMDLMSQDPPVATNVLWGTSGLFSHYFWLQITIDNLHQDIHNGGRGGEEELPSG